MGVVRFFGKLVSIFTVIVGIVYVVINLRIFIIDGYWHSVLVIIGIICLSFFSYIPYYIIYKLILKFGLKHFLIVIVSALFVIDILLRVNIIFHFVWLGDIFGLFFYSTCLLFLICVCWLVVWFWQQCIRDKKTCTHVIDLLQYKLLYYKNKYTN